MRQSLANPVGSQVANYILTGNSVVRLGHAQDIGMTAT